MDEYKKGYFYLFKETSIAIEAANRALASGDSEIYRQCLAVLVEQLMLAQAQSEELYLSAH